MVAASLCTDLGERYARALSRLPIVASSQVNPSLRIAEAIPYHSTPIFCRAAQHSRTAPPFLYRVSVSFGMRNNSTLLLEEELTYSYGERIVNPPYKFSISPAGEVRHPDIYFRTRESARAFAQALLHFLDYGESVGYEFRRSYSEIRLIYRGAEQYRWTDSGRAKEFAQELLHYAG